MKTSNKTVILFFEKYSIIQIIFLIKYIRKAQFIYFHKRSFPKLNHNSREKKIVERLILFFNRSVSIGTLPADKINDHTWVMNKKAVDVVEGLTDCIKNSAIYKTILHIIKDGNILKCYKMQLVDEISARLLFFKIAEDLIVGYKNNVYIIPAMNSDSEFEKEITREKYLKDHILQIIFKVNQFRNFFRKIIALIIFMLLPAGYVILNLKKITLRRINNKSYDIAMPVIWGFPSADVIVDGAKLNKDDGYLYNENIKPGQIVHIFRYWRSLPDVEESYKKIMDKNGIHYIDNEDYKINAKLLLIIAKIQFIIIKQILTNFFYKNDRYDYIWYSILIINWMIKKYLEFENVGYKVEFMRNDYNANHIVETILCNQNNKKTIGIQHAASPYELPILSYVHFDRYIVYGDIFVKNYSPHWERLHIVKAGRESIDWVVKNSNDNGEISRIRDRFLKLYKERKYTAVIAMSSDVWYNPESQWDEMYRALRRLKTLRDIDINLFMRFRRAEYLNSSPNMARFVKLPEWDDRVIIDHSNFSTYELMALCDLFIACNISFSINEALASKAKVFTFNLHGRAKYLYSSYGKDFILNTEEDIIRVFNGLRNNFKGFDCDWERLKKDCNFHYDGKNLDRIRESVWSLVR